MKMMKVNNKKIIHKAKFFPLKLRHTYPRTFPISCGKFELSTLTLQQVALNSTFCVK